MKIIDILYICFIISVVSIFFGIGLYLFGLLLNDKNEGYLVTGFLLGVILCLLILTNISIKEKIKHE